MNSQFFHYIYAKYCPLVPLAHSYSFGLKLNFVNVTDVRDYERITGQRCDFKHAHSTLILRVISSMKNSPVIIKHCVHCGSISAGIIQSAFCDYEALAISISTCV